MPISSDPTDTFDVKLAGGKAFKLRFITARESVKIAKLIKQAAADEDDEKALDLLDEAIVTALPAGSDKPSFSLSIVEMWELANLSHTAPLAEELERKKLSASAPATSQGPSAPAAPAASA